MGASVLVDHSCWREHTSKMEWREDSREGGDEMFEDAMEYINEEEERERDELFEDALCFIQEEVTNTTMVEEKRDSGRQGFPCTKCGLVFESKFEQEVHERRGHVARGQFGNGEGAGNVGNKGVETNNRNEAGCSSYRCERCNVSFERKVERDIHQSNCRETESENSSISSPIITSDSSQSGSQGSVRRFRCRRCNQYFIGRRALFVHHQSAHLMGGGDLQNRPWGDGANPFTNMPRGREMQRLYDTNKIYILAPHRESVPLNAELEEVNVEGEMELAGLSDDDGQTLKRVYNFPINEEVQDADIERQLDFVFSEQDHAFKINFSVGLILEHTSNADEELRYFKPAANVRMLDSPIAVWNRESLARAIREIQEKNINEYVKTLRPNSKYAIRFITQIEYYIYTTKFLLGTHTLLPSFVRDKKCILTRSKDSHGKVYEPNLCFFTALAQARRKHEGAARMRNVIPDSISLLRKWYNYLVERGEEDEEMSFEEFRHEFGGVSLSDFPYLEDCFEISINVFSLTSKDECKVMFISTKRYKETLNMNMFFNHLNLILDFKIFAKRYVCQICNKMFKNFQALKRHGSSCMWKTRYIFPGGYYRQKVSIFEEMEDLGVYVPENQRVYDFFAVWDLESCLEKVPIVDEKKLTYTHIHRPISCSIASNVPGHTEAHCIVTDDQQDLVTQMFEKFLEIWNSATVLSYRKWGGYLTMLKQKIAKVEEALSREQQQNRSEGEERSDGGENIDQLLSQCSGSDEENDEDEENEGEGMEEEKKKKKIIFPSECLLSQLTDVLTRFEQYLQQFVILSFNGSRYDAPLIKSEMSRYLFEQREFGERCELEEAGEKINCYIRPMGKPTLIKRGNHYSMISNAYFKFLDITNYLPPATSYANFLKSMEIEEKKFFFPYEFLTSYEKLNQSFLPPYPSQEWYSALKNVDLLNHDYEQWERSGQRGNPPKTGQENYEMIKETWNENGWTSMRDYLVYYNNCDTIPFVTAVSKLIEMYGVQDVDIFKQTISVPGLARIRMMKHAKQEGVLFSLFDKENRDLYHMFKSQLVAGPSIIFTRYQEEGVTPLRPDSNEICKSIYGYDVNSLYLYCIGGEMPTGDIVRRQRENNFTPCYNTRYSMMYRWLRYMEEKDNVKIRSRITNGKECKIGPFYVDGTATLPDGRMRIYEFNGCYWHRHNCSLNKHKTSKKDKEILERTIAREQFLKKCGFEVKTIWECEFRKLEKEIPSIQEQTDEFLSPFTKKNRKCVTEAQLMQGVMSGELSGFMLVDIEVPIEKKEIFKDFPPIFANQSIGFESIGKFNFYFISFEIKECVMFQFSRTL